MHNWVRTRAWIFRKDKALAAVRHDSHERREQETRELLFLELSFLFFFGHIQLEWTYALWMHALLCAWQRVTVWKTLLTATCSRVLVPVFMSGAIWIANFFSKCGAQSGQQECMCAVCSITLCCV